MVNKKLKITALEIGGTVLLRANPISDAINQIVAKLCDLFEGPYVIKRKIGDATYTLAHIGDEDKERGTFNIRQLKKYYEETKG